MLTAKYAALIKNKNFVCYASIARVHMFGFDNWTWELGTLVAPQNDTFEVNCSQAEHLLGFFEAKSRTETSTC